jgi:hypothetical protein
VRDDAPNAKRGGEGMEHGDETMTTDILLALIAMELLGVFHALWAIHAKLGRTKL